MRCYNWEKAKFSQIKPGCYFLELYVKGIQTMGKQHEKQSTHLLFTTVQLNIFGQIQNSKHCTILKKMGKNENTINNTMWICETVGLYKKQFEVSISLEQFKVSIRS